MFAYMLLLSDDIFYDYVDYEFSDEFVVHEFNLAMTAKATLVHSLPIVLFRLRLKNQNRGFLEKQNTDTEVL